SVNTCSLTTDTDTANRLESVGTTRGTSTKLATLRLLNSAHSPKSSHENCPRRGPTRPPNQCDTWWRQPKQGGHTPSWERGFRGQGHGALAALRSAAGEQKRTPVP